MYPDFEAIAKEEGHCAVARLFKAIGKVEVEHEREYLALKQMLEDEGFFESNKEDVWVCEVQHTFTGAKKHQWPVHFVA